MVPVEKVEELGAVANFWKARIAALRTELGMLHELKAEGRTDRTDGDRYAADRLLREIKQKAAETAKAEQSLRMVAKVLAGAPDVAAPLMCDTVMSAESARRAH